MRSASGGYATDGDDRIEDAGEPLREHHGHRVDAGPDHGPLTLTTHRSDLVPGEGPSIRFRSGVTRTSTDASWLAAEPEPHDGAEDVSEHHGVSRIGRVKVRISRSSAARPCPV